jgi:ubiquinone/menaquinone biosynthesis C-methylase UbiE
MLTVDQLASEKDRIQAAYARREIEVDKRLYSYFDLGRLFMMQERERQVLTLLREHGRDALADQKVLEIGCGDGQILRELIKWGARPGNLAGVDLRAEQIGEARRLCPDSVALHCGNAADLPFPDAAYDLVVQVTAFSSVLDDGMKRQMGREMLRVLKPEGAILWHDFFFNNPRNSDVRGIGLKEIRRLFPDCVVAVRRVTLAPPLTRLLAPLSWSLCYCLARLRVFNSHYLGLIFRAKRSGPTDLRDAQ